jgi:phosphoglycerate dehydrogenase-like enzyme
VSTDRTSGRARRERRRPRRARGAATVLVYHPDDAPRYAALIRAPAGVRVHVAATPAEAEPVVPVMDILYAWGFPRALYPKAERLTWLQAMAAGVEWALVPELPARVAVTRAPGIFGPWMAEYVVGWSAWVTQRMQTYREAQRRRQWLGTTMPDRLRGKTMTVVGLGDIGRAIARAARALGMRVIGVSRSGAPVAGVERVLRPRALAAALAAADFAVVVVPLTSATRGLIGAGELQAMKPGAWLINIGRGAAVDEAALIAALEARRIGGAVLDVFAEEPLPAAHPLWALDNAVITPHIAGPSVPEEIAPIFADNLRRWLAGRRLRHVVDRARGY